MPWDWIELPEGDVDILHPDYDGEEDLFVVPTCGSTKL